MQDMEEKMSEAVNEKWININPATGYVTFSNSVLSLIPHGHENIQILASVEENSIGFKFFKNPNKTTRHLRRLKGSQQKDTVAAMYLVNYITVSYPELLQMGDVSFCPFVADDGMTIDVTQPLPQH